MPGIATVINTTLGAAIESVFGTVVTPDRFFYCTSFSGGEKTETVEQPSMNQGSASPVARYSAEGKITCEISFEVLPMFLGFGTLLKWALGKLTTTGTDPYDHVYTIPAIGTDNPFATFEVALGDTGYADTYASGFCQSWEISATAGEPYVRFSAKALCQKLYGHAAKTSATYTSDPQMVHAYQAGTLGWNSATYTWKTIKWSGENGYERTDVSGTQYTGQPVRSGKTMVKASVTMEMTRAEYAAFSTAHQASTVSDLVQVFTSGSNTITITLHNAKLTDWPAVALSGNGRITATFGFTGYADATDAGVAIAVHNTQSSGLAA